jgi:hypothetical protein
MWWSELIYSNYAIVSLDQNQPTMKRNRERDKLEALTLQELRARVEAEGLPGASCADLLYFCF